MTTEVREVPLSRGGVALVGDGDYEAVIRYGWYACRYGQSVYAKRNLRLPDGRKTTQYMHAFILGVRQPGLIVDHRDGNGLNNLRSNLRLVTRGQNCRNQRSRPGASSEYVGVTRRRDQWIAQIACRDPEGRRQTQYLGMFASEEDAARARDRAAYDRDPEHCFLNFPEEYGR